ncbi:hypothetical protein MHYP_G00076350 [Metynnis hypsauchen]
MTQTSIQVETSASTSLCSPDQTDVDWENKVMQYLEAIKEQEEDEQEVVWPRDTLFRYYELMEELQPNLEEKRQHHLKTEATVQTKVLLPLQDSCDITQPL